MKKLLLFDIDKTLLVSSSDNDRFVSTINQTYGLNITSERDFNGYTDYLILVELLKSEGWDDKQIKSAMPKLLKELDRYHGDKFNVGNLKLLPGVKELLDALKDKVILGLVTGNLRPIAERKLRALNIWDYFSTGAYGDDLHTVRSDLVRVAIERSGYNNNKNLVYVIGDTPKDIIAASKAGVVNSVGVSNGFRDIQELIDTHAKIVLKDFTDTENCLMKLGIVC